MAVEKMKKMNIVGDLSVMDNVIIDILKTKKVNIINAQLEIDNNEFTFNLEKQKDLEKVLELNNIVPFERDESKDVIVKEARELMEFFGFDSIESKYIDNVDGDIDFENYYEELKPKVDRLNEINRILKNNERIETNYTLFENVDIDISNLTNLEYFNVRFGILDREARLKLKKNYGNIIALIFHTGTIEKSEVFLAIYPKEVTNEIDRILRSLNWQDVDIAGQYKGTAQEILSKYSKESDLLLEEKKEIESYRDKLILDSEDTIKKVLARMLLSEKIEEVKKHMVRSKKYFYLSGWIGVTDYEEIKDKLSKYKNLTFIFEEPDEKKITPPTKLKNNSFFRPFEMLLKMYGVPNYGEIDPTTFLGITYMILFGSMFGDVGQGAVFLIGGIIISKKINKGFGAILTRLGISSMIFGVLYGSVFGSEELIPALWMRPFDNINQVLIISVAFGIVLLSISYFLGFINKFKAGNIEELLFGKDGICGFIIFLLMTNLGVGYMAGISIVPTKISVGVILVALVLMIFKRPLAQKIMKQKVSYENGDVSGYYIEGSFSLIEALISILSNIISFIRVGAFAINHVGLFLAFQTIGEMTGSAVGNFIALLFGNILIIGLEGLIVFIQSLRLEYYEMFSKYYTGDGYEFVPAKVDLEEK
ncbi:V/A-type H+-transporting ATPase subunit I [Anaerosphaera aminiphila DSM 21120]|uniref:V/A-type H+-transporting ATPase subunit I n=1 Tax=Anaerosphaera aminiphila DSM 21120 TaxID=1120995 RepID=A0A1M5SSC7_9FIRM|nr:V-type ATPase 116kDa subunit family protein [Anaerosphaera aminiphila]SHH41208.1 V/A-type H+-transporting ATPase subunit I [Anaerosphaera aminiphila DSM 21120]